MTGSLHPARYAVLTACTCESSRMFVPSRPLSEIKSNQMSSPLYRDLG